MSFEQMLNKEWTSSEVRDFLRASKDAAGELIQKYKNQEFEPTNLDLEELTNEGYLDDQDAIKLYQAGVYNPQKMTKNFMEYLEAGRPTRKRIDEEEMESKKEAA